MKIVYQEIDLKKVTDYFAENFIMKQGEKLFGSEAFVDTAKKQVIFKLYIDEVAEQVK